MGLIRASRSPGFQIKRFKRSATYHAFTAISKTLHDPDWLENIRLPLCLRLGTHLAALAHFSINRIRFQAPTYHPGRRHNATRTK